MNFDPDNEVVKLCAAGMEREGAGKPAEASALFRLAWDTAVTPLEKCMAAHYLARHQPEVKEKLKWDKISLEHALLMEESLSKEMLPSLYLNIGKCYEDLGEPLNAEVNYASALTFCDVLPEDGYGNMIKSGVISGLKRIQETSADDQGAMNKGI